ncbi:hypothetical protein Tco_0827059 [Tanacetum coccineum]
MPWRHPDSCITDKVPTNFNQNHVDQLKAHIVKLRDIPKGVLVRSGLSRVMCDPVLRRSNNTIMSIHDFLCMPSLDKATVRDGPHELGTSILGRVADRTTSPAPTGIAIPRASLEEITVTRPDPKVVTKADHTAKQKTSTGPEISTNTAKRTRLSQKVSGAGFSGLAAGDGVEQTDDGTLDDDGQRDGSEFAIEDIGNLNDVSQDKEVEAHAELSRGVRRTTRASSQASHGVREDASSPAQEAVKAPDTQPLDTDAGADEIASNVNVDPYYEARVSNIAGDVLEIDLLPFVQGPYYIPYPYDEGSRSESPPYTKDDWEEIHGVNLGLQRKELYKDPKVCRTALDRFPTLVETHQLRVLSSVELSDRMSTQTIKKQRVDLKQQGEFTVHANEEVSRLKTKLGALKSKCESDFTPLVRKFLKSGEFNQAFAGVLNTTISVGVEHGLCIDRIDEEFRGLSQKVSGFIPDAKEKVTSSHQPSSATASLRANTHMRHFTSSSGTFGHTSTPEQLKKKKKSVEKGGPSAA